MGSKMRPSLFWALSRGKRPPQITYLFAPRESSFFSLEVCFAQKVDFAGRLFAIHFLGVFRADFGGSAPVKMWFWYRRGYENLLFQIANILAIKMSPEVVPKRHRELRGETLGSKMRPSLFWTLSRGKSPPQITHFLCLGGHPSSLWRCALPKKLILLGVCLQYTFWEFSGPILEGLHL